MHLSLSKLSKHFVLDFKICTRFQDLYIFQDLEKNFEISVELYMYAILPKLMYF